MKTGTVSHQPTPWAIGPDGVLRDVNGRLVRLSGLGTAMNATAYFQHADANRSFMLQAVNGLGRELAGRSAETIAERAIGNR